MWIANKKCKKCNKEKTIVEFYKHKDAKDGCVNICKECKKKYNYNRREKRNEYTRQWRLRNKERKNKYQRNYRKKNIDKFKEIDKKRNKGRRNYLKELQQKKRKHIIKMYGNKCVCCGETKYEFLAIDHINGGGLKHRRELGGTGALYSWIIKNNFPSGLRILCHNCNLSLGFYGFCPHKIN